MSINPPAPPPQTTRFTGPTSSNRQRNPYRNNNENNGGGMFYLPEGHSLTTEEAAFLNQHLPQSGEMPPAFNGDDHKYIKTLSIYSHSIILQGTFMKNYC